MRTLLIIYLLFSFNQLDCEGQENKGVKLIDFSYSECDDDKDYEEYSNSLISQIYRGDTLVLEVGVVSDCCPGFEGSINFNGEVLQLDSRKTGELCDCYCVYIFTYQVIGLTGKAFSIKMGEQEIWNGEE